MYDAPAADLVIGVSSLGSTIYTSLLDPEGDIDPGQIRFFGGVSPEPRSGMVTADFAESYPTLIDAQGKTDTPLRFANVVGSPADVIDESLAAPWVCEQLDLPCDMIPVAEGDSADMDIMVQRGEVNSDFTALGVMGRTYSDLLQSKKAYVAVIWDQEGAEVTYPEGVEEAPDLADILPEESKEEYELLLPMITGGGVGKNFWVGPEFDDGALEALKEAWATFSEDEEMYAPFDEIQTGGAAEGVISFSAPPLSAEETQKRYDESFATFQESRDKYTEIQQRIYDAYWK
jgi:hypothetical protein